MRIRELANRAGASIKAVRYYERLRLPFSMIADERLELADALGLPTFAAPGHEHLYARVTLVIRDGSIEHGFYPILPPNEHARQVLEWLKCNPA